MSVVETALKRPYTVVATLILITLMGIGAALRMPDRHFPGNRHSGRRGGVDLQWHERAGHPEPDINAA